MRAAVTHCCSLVGSCIWHLELVDNDSMATSSCGIVNRLRGWKDERESLSLHSALKSYSTAVSSGQEDTEVTQSLSLSGNLGVLGTWSE